MGITTQSSEVASRQSVTEARLAALTGRPAVLPGCPPGLPSPAGALGAVRGRPGCVSAQIDRSIGAPYGGRGAGPACLVRPSRPEPRCNAARLRGTRITRVYGRPQSGHGWAGPAQRAGRGPPPAARRTVEPLTINSPIQNIDVTR